MGPRGGSGSGPLTRMGAGSSPVPTSDSNMLGEAGGPTTRVCLMFFKQAFFEHTLWASPVLQRGAQRCLTQGAQCHNPSKEL